MNFYAYVIRKCLLDVTHELMLTGGVIHQVHFLPRSPPRPQECHLNYTILARCRHADDVMTSFVGTSVNPICIYVSSSLCTMCKLHKFSPYPWNFSISRMFSLSEPVGASNRQKTGTPATKSLMVRKALST